jgi:uracil-DNA glycosylase
VFLLWGAYAQAKGKVIDTGRHRVLRATHPSPLSAHRGFLGCGHFSAANRYLAANGGHALDWSLPRRAELANA